MMEQVCVLRRFGEEKAKGDNSVDLKCAVLDRLLGFTENVGVVT